MVWTVSARYNLVLFLTSTYFHIGVPLLCSYLYLLELFPPLSLNGHNCFTHHNYIHIQPAFHCIDNYVYDAIYYIVSNYYNMIEFLFPYNFSSTSYNISIYMISFTRFPFIISLYSHNCSSLWLALEERKCHCEGGGAT